MRDVPHRSAATDQLTIRIKLTKTRDLVADIDEAIVVFADVHRVIEICPAGDESAGAIENLDTVVFAIRDQDSVLLVDPDAMGCAEFAVAIAGLSPARQMSAICCEAMHGAVAVAIGDITLAVAGYER